MKHSFFIFTFLLLMFVGIETAAAAPLDFIFPQKNACSTPFTKNLKLGTEDPSVAVVQKILNIAPETRVASVGVGAPGAETTYFGSRTHAAVIRFQEKYKSEVLAPAGLSSGNGFVGMYTRTKLGEICEMVSSPFSEEDLAVVALSGFKRGAFESWKSFRNGNSKEPKNSNTTNSTVPTPVPNPLPAIPTPKPTPATTTSNPTPTPLPTTPQSGQYPLHTNITAAVFWVGEPVGNGSSEDNALSAWDDAWKAHYGGYDDYVNRNGYYPVGFTPKENPFYLDLPYNDFNNNGSPKSNRTTVVPWAKEKTSWSANESMMKNRWVKLTRNGVTCYGQIEDAGPYVYDDSNYVFSTTDARPASTRANSAGMDVSPAIRDCLKFSGINNVDNKVDWQFVNAADVPAGPWKEIVTTRQVYWP